MAPFCRLTLMLFLLGRPTLGQAAPPSSLVEDARLGPARAELRASFDAALREQVPEALLTDKLREGLAKGVPAPRIAQVIAGLERALAAARAEALPLVAAPPPGLLKAMVEAHAIGAARNDLASVLRAAAPHGPEAATRAVEVLTDLGQRGYPAGPASITVAQIARSSPASLAQLPAQAELLRSQRGASHAEALAALLRASAEGIPLDRAEQALRRGDKSDDGRGPGGDDGHGPVRESSGPRGNANGNGKGRGRGQP
jgi:hypothetical protein